MTFTVTIDRDEDGAWVVECPSIPGCVSQGKTKDEAIENIKCAIKQCLGVRAEQGLPLTVELRQAELDDLEHEVALIRENPELMALLEERSKPSETYTIDQVREMLGLD
jgi:predicted RNase H-like HicB family nuclease